MEVILQWVTSLPGRYLLTTVGGLILRTWSPLVMRAYPVLSGVANIILALLGGLFPEGAAHADSLSVVEVVEPSLASSILDSLMSGLLSWTTACGTHSIVKNTFQWLLAGAQIFKPKGG
jgi:hypothetical protein